MNIADWIILLIVALLVGIAVRILYLNKKNGKTCAGCPHAGSCSRQNCKDEQKS